MSETFGITSLREAIQRKELQANECRYELAKCDNEIASQKRFKETISFNLKNHERELAEMRADLEKLTAR